MIFPYKIVITYSFGWSQRILIETHIWFDLNECNERFTDLYVRTENDLRDKQEQISLININFE